MSRRGVKTTTIPATVAAAAISGTSSARHFLDADLLLLFSPDVMRSP
jgi:hypothetical protein